MTVPRGAVSKSKCWQTTKQCSCRDQRVETLFVLSPPHARASGCSATVLSKTSLHTLQGRVGNGRAKRQRRKFLHQRPSPHLLSHRANNRFLSTTEDEMSPRRPSCSRCPTHDEKYILSEGRLWAAHAARLLALGRPTKRARRAPTQCTSDNVGLVHERLTAPRGTVSKSTYRQITKQCCCQDRRVH